MDPTARARLSLDGLSIGDAFGQRFFVNDAVVVSFIESRALPRDPWYWTDDTAMALSIVEVLTELGRVDSDALAHRFAERYRRDPRRGYGGTAHSILRAISLGEPWADAASAAFDGAGSMGNGAAMRSAPVGAFFHDDLDAVVAHARASAVPTHAHPDGQAGAIAVAVAAALAARIGAGESFSRDAIFREVLARTPDSPTRFGLEEASTIDPDTDPRTVARRLGSGYRVVSSDTVPFSLWCALRHLDDFEEALWTTLAGLGDRDTTCAIVGGIVALAVGTEGIPEEFRRAREPLDSALTHEERGVDLG